MKIKHLLLSLVSIICISFAGFNVSASAAPINSDSENSIQTLDVPFVPDRCIRVKKVLPGMAEDGFVDIEAYGGTKYRLYDSNKVGIKAVKAEVEIEVMVGDRGQILGWRVL
ncbi:hypothetical protein [Bacillus toyonensis]|uniref:hypothetical protein n=1 Tax=Bacillus toyonensis TaxID=155322 RepID=UPI002853702B|nr:hypothetical protein [Bacillus toyonensis]MDR4974609.1 hypothetical protein [Bacillus toyonensis]